MTTGEVNEGADALGLECSFDTPFVARLALREKQVQQSYRPIIGIHKWFARRPGSLFRALLLSEFGTGNLASDYASIHNLQRVVADPFMGGGTTIFESLRLGISIVGSDVNPMSYWLVRQGVEPLDLDRFRIAANDVKSTVATLIDDLYKTECINCGDPAANVKYFLWVKTCPCPSCGETVSLFPGYRIAESVRHPREVYHCPHCDVLREVEPSKSPRCPDCNLELGGRKTRNGIADCLACDHSFKFAAELGTPPAHRLVGIEYHCPTCYASVKGRQFKTPDQSDHDRVARAGEMLTSLDKSLDLPDETISPGDETSRLLRWNYLRYRDMFTDRQLLGLGLLMRRIREVHDAPTRHALATVFSDFLRYQNLLCRYDTYALKCQDIFAVHGFPVGLMACENNLLGIPKVGSGSFVHFVEKYIKAKMYAKRPYETIYHGNLKQKIAMTGESIEAELADAEPLSSDRSAWLSCAPSQQLELAPNSLDGVFTDPPYFDMVQYAELMDFCYVWLRRIVRDDFKEFTSDSTRTDHEITGNSTRSRGQHEFTHGLSEVFQRMSFAMKPRAPLVFTYHHNDPFAYVPLVVAILDAGLTCCAVLPAPGEMAASLHIAGTKSSILDSVFVCRQPGSNKHDMQDSDICRSVDADVSAIRLSGYEPTLGDRLCLRAGYVAAKAVCTLQNRWDSSKTIVDRVDCATTAIREIFTELEVSVE
jgi:adenine-specific DNA methylase